MNPCIYWGFSAEKGVYHCVERKFFRQIWEVTCQSLSVLWVQRYCDCFMVLRRYKATQWPELPRCICEREKNAGCVPILASSYCTRRALTLRLLERCRVICFFITALTLRKSFEQYRRSYKHQKKSWLVAISDSEEGETGLIEAV